MTDVVVWTVNVGEDDGGFLEDYFDGAKSNSVRSVALVLQCLRRQNVRVVLAREN